MQAPNEAAAERVRGLIAGSGRSQGEFASAIGLDASKLSKSLSGARRFSSLDLARIADVCQVSVDWLLTGQQPPVAMAARSASGSPRGTAVEQARRLAALREDLAYLGYRQPWRPLGESIGTGRWAEQGDRLARAALGRLQDIGARSADADLPGVVESGFGADVAVLALGEGFDGLAVSTDGAKLIIVAPGVVPARQRFTVAHELGHLLAGDDQGLHLDKDIYGPESTKGPSEMRANAFAASFLMPADVLREAVPDTGIDREAFCALATRLAVSPSALAYRLAGLRLIDGMTQDALRRISAKEAAQVCGQGDVLAEATRRSAATRPPGLLARDALTAYTSGAATLRPYAEIVGIDVDSLRATLDDADEDAAGGPPEAVT
ncbi:MAG: helix-turn-helix domain-containing protein [Dermatophilaceae bacterium]